MCTVVHTRARLKQCLLTKTQPNVYAQSNKQLGGHVNHCLYYRNDKLWLLG